MKQRRLGRVLLVVAFVLSMSSTALATSDTDLWEAAGVKPSPESLMAPTFSLRDLGGHTISLEQFRGRVVMLYFWVTW